MNAQPDMIMADPVRANPARFSVFVPGTPTTNKSKEEIATFVNFIVPKARKAGFPIVMQDEAVRIGLIHCFKKREEAGVVTSSWLDLDNLAELPLSAIKRDGYPVQGNASVAVTDGLKVQQYHQGTIITLEKIADGFDPGLLDPIDYNAVLEEFPHLEFSPLKFPDAPLLQDGMSDSVDFFVPGTITSVRDVELYRDQILAAFYMAARECLFPEKIPPDALLHMTVMFCFPATDGGHMGMLKITPPDVPKLLKPFLDSLRIGPQPRFDDPVKPLPDDSQIVHLRALKIYEHDKSSDFPFIKPGIFCHIKLANSAQDMRPPIDLMERLRKAYIRYLQSEMDVSNIAGTSITLPKRGNIIRPSVAEIGAHL